MNIDFQQNNIYIALQSRSKKIPFLTKWDFFYIDLADL